MWKRGGGDFVLLLLLFLSVHTNFKYKLNSHKKSFYRILLLYSFFFHLLLGTGLYFGPGTGLVIIGYDDELLFHVCASFGMSLGFKLNGNLQSRHDFSALALGNS